MWQSVRSKPGERACTDITSSGYWINPAWVALDASRGIETSESKVFMRATVLAWDLLIYVPALLMFVKTWQASRSNRTQVRCCFLDCAR